MPTVIRDNWPEVVSSLVADLTTRWPGDRVTVEHYLALYPDLKNHAQEFLTLIHAEVILRRESGEFPAIEEYSQRFPDFYEELSRCWLHLQQDVPQLPWPIDDGSATTTPFETRPTVPHS